MKLQTKVVGGANKQNKLEYPCLMTPKEHLPKYNYVVLFEAPRQGVIVWADEHCCIYKVGHYSINWAVDHFEPFMGVIELRNVD